VGNAFPPLLAELIANNILKAESNGWFPGDVPKLAKYTLLDGDETGVQLELALEAGREAVDSLADVRVSMRSRSFGRSRP